jgi:anthranilate synthase component II
MKLLVLDNYDSFTYNLVYLVRQLGRHAHLEVVRNNKISVEEASRFDKILLSPGPGVPSEAGIMPQLIKKLAPERSILGVCLGHQGIAEVFGSPLYNIAQVLHGVPGRLQVVSDDLLFAGLPTSFTIGHYHSWAVQPQAVGPMLEVTATDELGHIMAIRHRKYPVRGVQFHPESIMTEHGKVLIDNWLKS